MKHTEQDEADAEKFCKGYPPSAHLYIEQAFVEGRRTLRQEVDRLIEKVSTLESALEKAMEGLKFYAKGRDEGVIAGVEAGNGKDVFIGETARTALAEIERIMGGK